MQNNIHKNSIQQKQKGSISNSDDNMYLPPIKYSPQTPHDHSVAVVGPMTMMACPSAPRPTSSRSTSILAATGPSVPCLDAVDTLPIHQRSQAAINQRDDSNRRSTRCSTQKRCAFQCCLSSHACPAILRSTANAQ
eukprot:scaffold7400_cov122-Skeletonema_menzelii.AAC.7